MVTATLIERNSLSAPYLPSNDVDVVNLTGHELTLTDGNNIVMLASQGRARAQSSEREMEWVMLKGSGLMIPIVHLGNRRVMGLPGPQEGVLYIVSGLIASIEKDRNDVVAPGRLLRESKGGRVKGARAFVKAVD